jgi:hypothetical protein
MLKILRLGNAFVVALDADGLFTCIGFAHPSQEAAQFAINAIAQAHLRGEA